MYMEEKDVPYTHTNTQKKWSAYFNKNYSKSQHKKKTKVIQKCFLSCSNIMCFFLFRHALTLLAIVIYCIVNVHFFCSSSYFAFERFDTIPTQSNFTLSVCISTNSKPVSWIWLADITLAYTYIRSALRKLFTMSTTFFRYKAHTHTHTLIHAPKLRGVRMW